MEPQNMGGEGNVKDVHKEEVESEEDDEGEVEKEEGPQPHEVFVDEFKSLISDEYFQMIKEQQAKIVRKLQTKTEHVNLFNEKMKKQYLSMKSDFQSHIGMMKEMKDDLKYIQEKVASIKRKIETPIPPTNQPKSQSMNPSPQTKRDGVNFSKSL